MNQTISKDKAVALVSHWSATGSDEAIERQLKFSTFSDAFAFMTHVALKAEAMDHHPNWSNVYNQVSIQLTTHDANGITQKDIDLARHINDVAARFLK